MGKRDMSKAGTNWDVALGESGRMCWTGLCYKGLRFSNAILWLVDDALPCL